MRAIKVTVLSVCAVVIFLISYKRNVTYRVYKVMLLIHSGVMLDVID